MILYFSATGNTKYAAETLAELLDDEALDLLPRIKSHDYSQIRSEKPFVICSPVFVSEMPRFLAGYLKKTPLAGEQPRLFYIHKRRIHRYKQRSCQTNRNAEGRRFRKPSGLYGLCRSDDARKLYRKQPLSNAGTVRDRKTDPHICRKPSVRCTADQRRKAYRGEACPAS